MLLPNRPKTISKFVKQNDSMPNNTFHQKLLESKPQTISIGEFVASDIRFYIPSYQRGYRWGANEIIRLIKDIEQYDPSIDGSFYCLQPIVVRYDKVNGYWRVVDGQQRLTTVFLILTEWDVQPFTIDYQRDERKSPVEKHYISEARNILRKFKEEHPECVAEICKRLKANCRVIWYRLADSYSDEEALAKEHEYFLHLNSGKIALTDAELVKATLLHNINRSGLDTENFNRKQQRRASQWDLMERTLREKKFWTFIAGRKTLGASALDYLLEIIYFKHDQPLERISNQQNPIFSWIESYYESIRDIDTLWEELWTTFHRLEGWYNDATIYNLIGVLTTRVSSREIASQRIVRALKEWDAEGSTKQGFITWLWKEAADGILSENDISKAKRLTSQEYENADISLLPSYHGYRYDTTKGKVFDFLLLMNIVTLNPGHTNRKFPFEEFNSSDNIWNIEHISPKTPKKNCYILSALVEMKKSEEWDSMPSSVKKQFDEIIGILSSINPEDNEALEFPENPTEQEIKQKAIFDKFMEDYLPLSDTEVMTLGNLTLLTDRPNKGIGNNFFLNKRRMLAEYQSKGCFIPPLTLNVFTKWYTQDYDQPLFWRKKNRLEYLKALDKLVASLYDLIKKLP